MGTLAWEQGVIMIMNSGQHWDFPQSLAIVKYCSIWSLIFCKSSGASRADSKMAHEQHLTIIIHQVSTEDPGRASHGAKCSALPFLASVPHLQYNGDPT